jgi:hypothetical protein
MSGVPPFPKLKNGVVGDMTQYSMLAIVVRGVTDGSKPVHEQFVCQSLIILEETIE